MLPYRGFVGGKLVDRQPLLWRDDPARQATTQHHGMTRLQLLLSTGSTNITVILLVHAVETDQQEVIAAKATGQTIGQVVSDGAAQKVTLFFRRSASVSLPSTTNGPGF